MPNIRAREGQGARSRAPSSLFGCRYRHTAGMPQLGQPTEREQRLLALLWQDAPQSEPDRVVAEFGQNYAPRARPDDVAVRAKRACFRNAFRLADERPELTYVEGFALPEGTDFFHYRHAWCVDNDELVVDPTRTWADPGGRLPEALRGIVLPLELVRDVVDIEELHRGALERFARDGRIDEIIEAVKTASPS